MATRKTTPAPQDIETKSAVPAKVAQAGLPADLGDELQGLASLGYSQKAEDSLIPIVGILQDNSGEVKKKHDRYLEGAEPGMMIIRSLQKLYSGEDGTFVFQPCGFQHMWVEWNGEPGEGAPVSQYPFDDRPDDAREVDDPQNPDRKIWKMPNGNRLVDTRYHFGHIISDGFDPIPAVIPMAGTNHGISRQWTALMKQFRIPGTGQAAPAWFRAYAITTAFTQRGSQSWYKYAVKDMGWIGDKALRQAGRNMSESVSKMEIRADIESEAVEVEDEAARGPSVHDDNIPV